MQPVLLLLLLLERSPCNTLSYGNIQIPTSLKINVGTSYYTVKTCLVFFLTLYMLLYCKGQTVCWHHSRTKTTRLAILCERYNTFQHSLRNSSFAFKTLRWIVSESSHKKKLITFFHFWFHLYFVWWHSQGHLSSLFFLFRLFKDLFAFIFPTTNIFASH